MIEIWFVTSAETHSTLAHIPHL